MKRTLTPLGKALKQAGACDGEARRFRFSKTASAFQRATYYHLDWYVRRVLRATKLVTLATRIREGYVAVQEVSGGNFYAGLTPERLATRILADVIRAAHPELRDVRRDDE